MGHIRDRPRRGKDGTRGAVHGALPRGHGPRPLEEVVSFHCMPRERKIVRSFTSTVSSNLALGIDTLTEYQFARRFGRPWCSSRRASLRPAARAGVNRMRPVGPAAASHVARPPVSSAKESQAMVDREKVLSVLHKRFPGASRQQMAWAANAIVGLDDEWEEVVALNEPEIECSDSVRCGERCYLADRIHEGTEFRMFQKRPADVRS